MHQALSAPGAGETRREWVKSLPSKQSVQEPSDKQVTMDRGGSQVSRTQTISTALWCHTPCVRARAYVFGGFTATAREDNTQMSRTHRADGAALL